MLRIRASNLIFCLIGRRIHDSTVARSLGFESAATKHGSRNRIYPFDRSNCRHHEFAIWFQAAKSAANSLILIILFRGRKRRVTQDC